MVSGLPVFPFLPHGFFHFGTLKFRYLGIAWIRPFAALFLFDFQLQNLIFTVIPYF
jgi:hypothetical protein